jgi:uncharacterized protein YqgC (DUF456 family)
MPTDPHFWLQVSLQAVALLIMLVSLVALIVPIFPGLIVIWLVSLGYGLVTGFTLKGWIIFGILTVLVVIGNLIDNILMGAKARKSGAAWLSIGLGIVAGIVGSLAFPPFGGIIGAPLILFLVEFIRVRQARQALNSVGALIIGWGWSFVARFIIGLLMIGLWLVWAWT